MQRLPIARSLRLASAELVARQMLTAAHGDRVERQAEAGGADLFLTKRFSPLDLLRLVDQLSDQMH